MMITEKRTFLSHPNYGPYQQKKKMYRRLFSFQSCYENTIENDDECRKQKFSILPVTRVMDLNSLPAEKKFLSTFVFSFKSGCERYSKR